MKTSAQIFLLLALISLLVLTFSVEVSVTKGFNASVTVHSPSSSNGNGGGRGPGNGGGNGPGNGSGNGLGNETLSGEEAEALPGADSFNACDPNNRPEACTLEYAPVCGYINRCQGGACTATFGNNCSACANSTVDGYVNGACEDVRTTCDRKNRPDVCPLIYTATCAVAARCRGLHCFENTSSSCAACSIRRVAYSLPGICPGPDESALRVFCDANNRPEVCTADYNPVCARLSNCVGRDCWSTAGNACSACANENIVFYVPGECADFASNYTLGNQTRTKCDPSNRPDVCTLEYNPVCAHIIGCYIDDPDCSRTEGNSCTACSQEDVDFYIEGECPS